MKTRKSDQQVRVGVGALIWRDGKLLMMRRKGAHGDGTWSVPGGHMEFGESPVEAVAREVMEETGAALSRVNRGPYTDDHFPKEDKHYITLYFECQLFPDEQPRIMEPDRCSEMRWVDPQDLPFPLFLPNENLLAMGYDLKEPDDGC